MKLNRLIKKSLRGFSLIEVVVFVGLLNIILLAAVNYLITFTYQTRILEHKTYATFYQEEIKEWLDSEREADWTGLLLKAPVVPVTYCVNGNLTLNYSVASLASGSCGYDGVDTGGPQMFRRTVRLSRSGATQINAHIRVDWFEVGTDGAQKPFSQTFDTIYTQY